VQAVAKAATSTGARSLMSQWQRQAALAAAQKGLTSATMRYSAVQSALSFLGPVMWAWLAVDLVKAAVGTDYARVVRAVYILAQVGAGAAGAALESGARAVSCCLTEDTGASTVSAGQTHLLELGLTAESYLLCCVFVCAPQVRLVATQGWSNPDQPTVGGFAADDLDDTYHF
jgi:hypothetical protein